MTLMFIMAIIFLLTDQISKLLVVNFLNSSNSVVLVKDFFYLTYVHNTGAAFSILTGKRIFLVIVAIIIITILIFYLRKNPPKEKFVKVSYALIIGGSLGNLIDRVVRGYVVDFIDVKIFDYNFPIFNLADTFIVIGVLILLIEMIRKDKKK